VARLKRRESLCGALLVRLVDERGHLDDAKKLERGRLVELI